VTIPYWEASYDKSSYLISKVKILRTNRDPSFLVGGDEISRVGILVED